MDKLEGEKLQVKKLEANKNKKRNLRVSSEYGRSKAKAVYSCHGGPGLLHKELQDKVLPKLKIPPPLEMNKLALNGSKLILSD